VGKRTFSISLLIFIIYIVLPILWGAGEAWGWTVPVRLTGDPTSNPRAAVAGINIYVVEARPGYDFYFQKSQNNGRSWSQPTQPADTFYGGSWYPDIEYTPNGLIHVVWVGQYEGIFRFHAFHQSSSDGGEHWSRRHQIFNSGDDVTYYPSLAAKADTLFVAFVKLEGLHVFRSFNSGVTWGDSTVADSNYWAWPPTILYSQGRLHLIYMLGFSDIGLKIYYCRSDDLGLTWSTPTNLSTYDPWPPYYDSVSPSAYVDESGDIVASWLDYRYGYSCDGTADILSRISNDNGDTWLPETRLTYVQTGERPVCSAYNDTVVVLWPDASPFGCDTRKLSLSTSGNWGRTWSEPQIIAGDGRDTELGPFLFHSDQRGEIYLHCLFNIPSRGYGTYYIRNKPFYSDRKVMPDSQPVFLKIDANPNVFNLSTVIGIENSEGGEVEISIFNILGQKLWSKTINGKEGSVIWDATDASGKVVSSGLYIAVASSRTRTAHAKLLYLK